MQRSKSIAGDSDPHFDKWVDVPARNGNVDVIRIKMTHASIIWSVGELRHASEREVEKWRQCFGRILELVWWRHCAV